MLTWVAAGRSNCDIADILGASSRTVAKHLEHAYAKLGVETRTAVAVRLVARPSGPAGRRPRDSMQAAAPGLSRAGGGA